MYELRREEGEAAKCFAVLGWLLSTKVWELVNAQWLPEGVGKEGEDTTSPVTFRAALGVDGMGSISVTEINNSQSL